ncbi:MAG: TldD/PmbA family protein [Thermoplasmata archaeon]|nr:TldD/PmbA family protein [Thermoplasmata archaeon]MCI4358839.1 TldD/PmbA family protein [Thermoplasmata archaeon]
MPGVVEVDDLLARLLHRIERHAPYAEVMAEETTSHLVRYDRSATVVEPSPGFRGAMFRAWGPKGWTEAGASGLEADSLTTAADSLIQHLGFAGGAPDPPGESSTQRGEASTKTQQPMGEVPVSERVALAQTWFAWATEVKGIRNAYATIQSRTDIRLFLSTAGARTLQTIDRTRGAVAALAIENGKVEYDFTGRGGMGGAEILAEITPERVSRAAHAAVELLQAPSPPVGRMKVLLDPSASGTFAHESFGHGAEADQMLRDRSYLKPLFGKVLGPESLTLVDDGSLPGGWGSIFFDDEGHPSGRTVLVDHGKFIEALHDRETAAALHRRATGNTRRADFLSRPFVRMTNTFVEPGAMHLEEMVREMRDGVILESCTSGIEDPLGGNMQIKVKKGHLVRGGEIGPIRPSMALSGRVLEFLTAIRGVSRKEDFEMSPGYCGKGHTDLLPTGTGGPYLLSEAIVGPA